jgi:hypothetical protein
MQTRESQLITEYGQNDGDQLKTQSDWMDDGSVLHEGKVKAQPGDGFRYVHPLPMQNERSIYFYCKAPKIRVVSGIHLFGFIQTFNK